MGFTWHTLVCKLPKVTAALSTQGSGCKPDSKQWCTRLTARLWTRVAMVSSSSPSSSSASPPGMLRRAVSRYSKSRACMARSAQSSWLGGEDPVGSTTGSALRRSVVGGVGSAAGEESGACVASDGVTGVGETVECAAPALAADVLLVLPDVVGVGTAGSEFPAAERTGVLLSALARAPRRRPLREGPLPLPKFTLLEVDAIVESLLHTREMSQDADWSFTGSRSPEG